MLYLNLLFLLFFFLVFSDSLQFSRSVTSDSFRPHGLYPSQLLCPGISQAGILEWAAISYSMGQGDPLEKGMATYSSILAWETPWTEEPSQ